MGSIKKLRQILFCPYPGHWYHLANYDAPFQEHFIPPVSACSVDCGPHRMMTLSLKQYKNKPFVFGICISNALQFPILINGMINGVPYSYLSPIPNQFSVMESSLFQLLRICIYICM